MQFEVKDSHLSFTLARSLMEVRRRVGLKGSAAV